MLAAWVAGRCRRLLDAVRSQFKAGEQRKVILEAPPQHDIRLHRMNMKNPQFRTDTEQGI
jgi:hypothetical protein